MTDNLQTDPRLYLAAERTFLAWIRTGLSLMGFGFVVARFGLFLKESEAMQPHLTARPTGFSVGFGTTLVMVGVVMNVIAAFEHIQTVRKIRANVVLDQPSSVAIATSVILVIVGIAMASYLVTVR